MDIITALLLLSALTVLAWGFYRARPLGTPGILAWLQSVVLTAPWLLTIGFVAIGVPVNIAGILFLLVLSIGVYVFLGNRLRATGQALPVRQAHSLQESSSNKDKDDIEAVVDAQPADTAQNASVMPIPVADLKAIEGIFGIDTFFVTETIPYQEGAIFKGNLREDPQVAYSRLSQGLNEHLSDRYRLFLVEQDGKPIVVILPSRNDPKPATLVQKILAGILLLATVFTSLETAALLQNFDLLAAPARFQETLPIGLGVLSILGVHEVGHRLLARRHQVRLSPPFFIPAWEIASFGALTRFESLLPRRHTLFDVAVAGPAAGGMLSLAFLLVGLFLSNAHSLFQIPAPFFQESILVGTLARVILGDGVQQSVVAVHPLVVIGWLGLVITALNLMPAGQLDGGRVVQAIYGRKTAGRATVITLVVLAIASLFNPLALYWALVILFLQRDLERPSLNELSEPDDARAALGLLVLFLMAAILLPLTPGLAARFGIGG